MGGHEDVGLVEPDVLERLLLGRDVEDIGG